MPPEFIAHTHIIASAVVVAFIVVTATWLLFGRPFSLAADALLPRRAVARPFDPITIQFDPAGISSRLALGSQSWSFSWPTLPGHLN
jgi:hypothetical protein